MGYNNNNGDDSNKSELQQITRAVITHAIIDARRQFPLYRNQMREIVQNGKIAFVGVANKIKNNDVVPLREAHRNECTKYEHCFERFRSNLFIQLLNKLAKYSNRK